MRLLAQFTNAAPSRCSAVVNAEKQCLRFDWLLEYGSKVFTRARTFKSGWNYNNRGLYL